MRQNQKWHLIFLSCSSATEPKVASNFLLCSSVTEPKVASNFYCVAVRQNQTSTHSSIRTVGSCCSLSRAWHCQRLHYTDDMWEVWSVRCECKIEVWDARREVCGVSVRLRCEMWSVRCECKIEVWDVRRDMWGINLLWWMVKVKSTYYSMSQRFGQ